RDSRHGGPHCAQRRPNRAGRHPSGARSAQYDGYHSRGKATGRIGAAPLRRGLTNSRATARRGQNPRPPAHHGTCAAGAGRLGRLSVTGRTARASSQNSDRTATVKITALETIQLEEFPNLVWVRVHTDEGLIGLGETFFGASSVAA